MRGSALQRRKLAFALKEKLNPVRQILQSNNGLIHLARSYAELPTRCVAPHTHMQLATDERFRAAAYTVLIFLEGVNSMAECWTLNLEIGEILCTATAYTRPPDEWN